MHTNKVLRNGVDTNKAAVAAISQALASAIPQAGAGGTTAATLNTKKVSWMKRFLSRVFNSLLPLIRPTLYRYREYLNRPTLEQMTRLESKLSSLDKLYEDKYHFISHITLLQQRLDRIESYALAASRRATVSCDKGVLVRSTVGYVLCNSNDTAQLACLIEAGELEAGTRLLIERIVCPGMTYVDVGANIGLHTLAAARAMRGVGKVVAFEPYGPTYSLLTESVFINGFVRIVEIHEAAVSSQSGMQRLYLGKSSGHHSIYALEENGALGSEVVEVPVVTLAEVIPRETRIDLIKIDVEGAEIEVLKSARPFIEANPDIALIVEFGPSHLKRVGFTVEEWFKHFSSMGLVYQAIDPDDGTLSRCEQQALAKLESINLLFARRDSTVWGKVCETE